MSIEMVFNDLSLEDIKEENKVDKYKARKLMSDFVDLLSTGANQYGFKRQLRANDSFFSMKICPEYTIGKWVFDKEIVKIKEKQQYLLRVATKIPYLNDLEELEDKLNLCEYALNGKKSIGLGVTHLLGGVAVSINSCETWDCKSLEINFSEINENGDLTDEDTDSIYHASKIEHLERNRSEFNILSLEEISNQSDLWNKKERIFPHLDFCPRVEEQIYSLDIHKLKNVRNKLARLEEYCTDWSAGSFSAHTIGCKCSPESGETLEKYEYEHTFEDEESRKFLFSYHLYFGDGRIFFYPNESEHRILIGHIGRKLPNVTYPT
jgi:hypothetical protein